MSGQGPLLFWKQNFLWMSFAILTMLNVRVLRRPFPQPPVRWVSGFFPGVKRPGRDVDNPPPSRSDVNEM